MCNYTILFFVIDLHFTAYHSLEGIYLAVGLDARLPNPYISHRILQYLHYFLVGLSDVVEYAEEAM